MEARTIQAVDANTVGSGNIALHQFIGEFAASEEGSLSDEYRVHFRNLAPRSHRLIGVKGQYRENSINIGFQSERLNYPNYCNLWRSPFR